MAILKESYCFIEPNLCIRATSQDGEARLSISNESTPAFAVHISKVQAVQLFEVLPMFMSALDRLQRSKSFKKSTVAKRVNRSKAQHESLVEHVYMSSTLPKKRKDKSPKDTSQVKKKRLSAMSRQHQGKHPLPARETLGTNERNERLKERSESSELTNSESSE